MNEIKLIIDDKEINTKLGEKILWVALDNGIYIPNLCAIREIELPYGGCRLCLVEVEANGRKDLITSCSQPAIEGMKVYTNTDEVRKLQRIAFELLMTDHDINCPECLGRTKCQLLKIAAFLKLKIEPKKLKKLERHLSVDNSHPDCTLNPNKCVKCSKCIYVGKKQLNFAYRGIDMTISTFDNIPLANLNKNILTECAKICPTGAFSN